MMLAPIIAVVSPSLAAAPRSISDYSRCLYKPAVPLRPIWLSRLLRREGAALALEGATVFRWIGELRSDRTRYTLYHYIHDTPTAGSCHGIDAIIVLRGGRYVGNYFDIGPSACRVRGDTLICRDTIDSSEYRIRFARGRAPRRVVLGGERIVFAR